MAHAALPNGEPPATKVVPFGIYGGGLLTGHPIGLGSGAGVVCMGLMGLPEARLFFAASTCLGVLLGFALWLRHR